MESANISEGEVEDVGKDLCSAVDQFWLKIVMVMMLVAIVG